MKALFKKSAKAKETRRRIIAGVAAGALALLMILGTIAQFAAR